AAVVVRPPRRSRRGVRAVALVLVAAGLDDFAGPTAQWLAVGVGSPLTSDRALPGDRDHIGGPDRAARGPHAPARLIGRRPAPRTGHGTPRRAGPAARPRDRVAGCRNGGAPGRVPWPDVRRRPGHRHGRAVLGRRRLDSRWYASRHRRGHVLA